MIYLKKLQQENITLKTYIWFWLEGRIIVGPFYTFDFPRLTIVFIKFFGMTVVVDNLANNFADSLTLVGQYDINKNLILIFTIAGATRELWALL